MPILPWLLRPRYLPVLPIPDYHLKSGSPAINTGLASMNSVSAPSADIEGTGRPQGSGYDIGAYEYTENGPPPNSPQSRPQHCTWSIDAIALTAYLLFDKLQSLDLQQPSQKK